MVYKHYPFGMLQPGMYFENEDPRTRFGFNGMLRDDDIKDKFSTSPDDEGRGNSYDFGARMYDPRVARWFTLDPSRQKYPNISPYTFAANNPVLFIDPDGKDYSLFVDHDKQTITVKATYISINEQSNMTLEKSVNFWNKQSGKFSYEFGSGEDKMSYNINFELTITESGQYPPITEKGPTNTYKGLSEKEYKALSFTSANSEGSTSETFIHLNLESTNVENVSHHEVGHTLGIDHHEGFGLMSKTGNRSIVWKFNIDDVLGQAGIGINKEKVSEPGVGRSVGPSYDSQRKEYFETGNRPENFEKGRVK